MERSGIQGLRSGRTAYQIKNKGKSLLWSLTRAVFILGFSFVILYPLLSMISRAFMDPGDFYDSSVLWLPKNFSLVNIKISIRALKYGSAFINSLWSSTLMTLLQLFSCLFAGYAFARYKFPLSRIIFVLVIVTLIVPPQLTMISSYMFFSELNILDSGVQLPMIIMSATGMGIRAGLFIYMFRQFFISIPKETEEAAMVDGAGHFLTFFKVMLPSALTIIVTVALFSFVWQWNDIFYTNLYDRGFNSMSNNVFSANFGNILELFDEYSGFSIYDPVIKKNLQSTAAIMVISPLILLFLLMQKYFVESVERSGVVG